MEHTTAPAALPPLLAALVTLLVDHRPAFRQTRTYHRAMALVFGWLWSLGRHTLTQTLLALGCSDTDWTAFYRLFSRQRIVMPHVQQRLLHQTFPHVPPTQPYVVAVDGVAVPRSSRRMPGVGWRRAPTTAPWRPGLALAQRFGALHWLPPLQHGFTRAIPLLSYPIFTPKARPAAVPPQREWEGALAALTTLRAELDAAGRMAQPVVLLADGSYDVTEFWNALPPQVVLLVRTARNRALCHLPEPTPRRRGAPRKYGVAAPRPAEWLLQRRGWQTTTQEVRGHPRQMRYRIEGPFVRRGVPTQPVFLVLMGGQTYRRGQQRKYREPVPVLVTARRQADGMWQLPLAVPDLLVWLWQRWEVEVAHREFKSGFGVGEMQCWHPLSAVATIQWGIWVYAVCVLAAYRSWGICGGPQPPGRWRRAARRWSLNTLWRTIRAEGLQLPEFPAGCAPMPGNWVKKEQWIAWMTHAIHYSARI